MNSHFSTDEIPLIPSAMYGMRGFAIRDGHLYPLHRGTDVAYEPGVNEAFCDTAGDYELIINGKVFRYKVGTKEARGENILHSDRDREVVPSKACACGYYAYFDQTEDLSFLTHSTQTNRRINGIVRATGRCIVGTRGFRAQKIELVALVGPNPDAPRKLRERLAQIPHKIVAMPGWSLFLFLLAYLVVAGVNMFFESSILTTIGWVMVAMCWTYTISTGISMFYLVRHGHSFSTAGVDMKTARALKKTYPDVEFFPTLQAAREKYPLTKATDIPQ
jgi:hypothetical protein